jgi:hypothetical protein
MVSASRRHLTERYATGVERLLWETEKRYIPDLDVIRLVTDAAAAGQADALDLGAALVLVQAGRLQLDGLEYEIFEGAHAVGMRQEAIAAILELPDAAAAGERRRWLEERQALRQAEAEQPRRGELDTPAEAAARAGLRASRAASRAAEAAMRYRQLTEVDPGEPVSRRDHAERAVARAEQARMLADEAAERVALGLVRAAAAFDRCAVRCEELIATTGNDDPDLQIPELRRKAAEYHQAAVRYREMAAQYRGLGRRPA